jgi:hypothetical protein
MLHRTAPQRWRRALVALALILGQLGVTAAAAGARCARAYAHGAAAPETDAVVVDASSGAGAEERAPAPDGRLPDGPSAPGSSPCSMLMLVQPVAEESVPAAERVGGAVPPDEAAPQSPASPPPYHPPRA